jgi:hypothetical protein
MARVQVDSRVGAEALQTVALPRQQAVQQRFDPNESKAYQLATALGANQPIIDKLFQEQSQRDQEQAVRDAGAMGAEELGKKVKSGELPTFRSPVYVATLKHVYGENGVEALKNEIHEGIKNNTLNFESDAQLNEYITKKRNEFLAGADRFTITGFDKNLNQYRQTLSALNTSVLSKRTADRAEAEVYDNLKNIYNSASTDPNVTADGRVEQIVNRYKNYRSDNVAILATPEKQREALVMVARIAAENKDRGFLDRFLKADLGDGVTVEKVLGPKGVDAINREVDQVETRQYYQRLRAKSDATDQMTDVVIAEIEAGRDPLKTVLNDERFSALEKTEKIRLITRTRNTLSGADGSAGFGTAKMEFINSQFDGIDDPDEAVQMKYQLLTRASSKEERSYIKEIYSRGKFVSPYADPGFRMGKQIVQLAHKSTDSFIGSDTYGPALRNFQKDWSETFYLSGDELAKRFPEDIPEESKGKNMARLPLRVKEAIATKIADKQATIMNNANKQSPGLSDSSRPVNPNSNRTLNNNETVRQGDITIKKVPETK